MKSVTEHSVPFPAREDGGMHITRSLTWPLWERRLPRISRHGERSGTRAPAEGMDCLHWRAQKPSGAHERSDKWMHYRRFGSRGAGAHALKYLDIYA